jgi:hypothetical protein
MTRLLLVLAAVTLLLLPGAASAAACSPMSCAPSQAELSNGSFLAYRTSSHAPVTVADLRTGESLASLPWGFLSGNVLVHQQGRRIEWYDARTGKKTAERTLPGSIRLAGASQDGSRAVAFRSKKLVAIVTPTAVREVSLPVGNWDFDALRGNNLMLIKYLSSGYQVRQLDLASASPTTRLLKDPHESGTIWGQPWSRLSSRDGRYVFTLYLASNGAAMVHELDLAKGRARCIDLPGTGSYGAGTSWGMAESPDGRTLWLAGPGYKRVIAIDIRTRKVMNSFSLSLPNWTLGSGTRISISPDGTRLALTDRETVAVVDLGTRKVVSRTSAKAVAVGWSPSGELRVLL